MAALRGAFSALELIVGIMLAVLSPVVDACGRRARVLYRWAHFIVGCLIALLGSVAVSAALALPAWTTFAVVAALWWSVFLPTEDLVAMHRSGHVSPAYVRFALLALADVVGARDVHKTYVDESDDESEEDGPAEEDDEGNANVPRGSSPGKGAATRPVGSQPRDASDSPSNAWNEAERLRDRKLREDKRKRAVLYRQVNRHVMVPLRVAMRAILRWQGLISSSEEERLELERLRREARAASGGGGDDFNRKGIRPRRRREAQGVAAPVDVAAQARVRPVQPEGGQAEGARGMGHAVGTGSHRQGQDAEGARGGRASAGGAGERLERGRDGVRAHRRG